MKKKKNEKKKRDTERGSVQYGTVLGYRVRNESERGGWEPLNIMMKANLESWADYIEPTQTAAMRTAHQHT